MSAERSSAVNAARASSSSFAASPESSRDGKGSSQKYLLPSCAVIITALLSSRSISRSSAVSGAAFESEPRWTTYASFDSSANVIKSSTRSAMADRGRDAHTHANAITHAVAATRRVPRPRISSGMNHPRAPARAAVPPAQVSSDVSFRGENKKKTSHSPPPCQKCCLTSPVSSDATSPAPLRIPTPHLCRERVLFASRRTLTPRSSRSPCPRGTCAASPPAPAPIAATIRPRCRATRRISRSSTPRRRHLQRRRRAVSGRPPSGRSARTLGPPPASPPRRRCGASRGRARPCAPGTPPNPSPACPRSALFPSPPGRS
mmetsp:Transcript_15829/g.66704  ORF Transcript_15829/g.66704 Transcript_15829/m.66704 type:complete len:318 (+) Transcript_15829:703-1656(+)